MFKLLAVALSLGIPSFASISFEVFPSPAPNAFGSPSWNPGYVQNALNALENGLSSVGDPATDPTAYYQVTQETDLQNIVTGFPSWLGSADPGTVFGPAFANELGNRLHFGLHIVDTGGQFSLSELSFDMESSDPGDTFQFVGDFAGASDAYSSTRIGINYGPDGVKGGGDDVLINSGPASQLINELVYVGVGNAVAPGGSCTGTDQSTIDCIKAFYDSISPFSISTTYTLTAPGNIVLGSASASVDLVSTPEPATFGLLLTGALALIWKRRSVRGH
jgi:hypothetical protein